MHVDGVMKTKPRPVDEAKQGHVSFFNDGDCEHRQTVRINPALNLLDAPPTSDYCLGSCSMGATCSEYRVFSQFASTVPPYSIHAGK